jgi:hypothetical protein
VTTTASRSSTDGASHASRITRLGIFPRSLVSGDLQVVEIDHHGGEREILCCRG